MKVWELHDRKKNTTVIKFYFIIWLSQLLIINKPLIFYFLKALEIINKKNFDLSGLTTTYQKNEKIKLEAHKAPIV